MKESWGIIPFIPIALQIFPFKYLSNSPWNKLHMVE